MQKARDQHRVTQRRNRKELGGSLQQAHEECLRYGHRSSRSCLGELARTQLSNRLVQQAARAFEFATYGGILDAVQDRNDGLPTLGITFAQAGFDLADSLGRE